MRRHFGAIPLHARRRPAAALPGNQGQRCSLTASSCYASGLVSPFMLHTPLQRLHLLRSARSRRCQPNVLQSACLQSRYLSSQLSGGPAVWRLWLRLGVAIIPEITRSMLLMHKRNATEVRFLLLPPYRGQLCLALLPLVGCRAGRDPGLGCAGGIIDSGAAARPAACQSSPCTRYLLMLSVFRDLLMAYLLICEIAIYSLLATHVITGVQKVWGLWVCKPLLPFYGPPYKLAGARIASSACFASCFALEQTPCVHMPGLRQRGCGPAGNGVGRRQSGAHG